MQIRSSVLLASRDVEERHEQVQISILQEQKSGRRGDGGLGWGLQVVRHIPWGALTPLSGSRGGHERVFWGHCAGFRATAYFHTLRNLDGIQTELREF
jgi:hypothetical protein